MKKDLMNMSSVELDVLEQNLGAELDIKLRNMMYDDHLDNLFEEIEDIKKEKQRRGIKNNG